jgi:ketosteroid isomerase-like protein
VSENLDLVRAIYAALNDAYRTGAYDDPVEFVHPDVVLRTSGMFPESGEYHGRAGVRQFTENQAQAFESMAVEPQEYLEFGDRVVVPVRFGGRARHTGIDTFFEVVHVWLLRDGKVAELVMHRSREEAIRSAEG